MKGVLLISTGIDSPVAGYMMLKKGIEVVGVHFNSSEEDDTQVIEELAQRLGEVTSKDVTLYVVPNGGFHEQVGKNCNTRFHCILCKRFLYRVAEKIAQKGGCQFLITGESIGQVASQTLGNLRVLDASTTMPVIRPIIGFDKEDTIKIAKDIGTYELSSKVTGGCPYVPKKPATNSQEDTILKEESKIELEKLISEAVGEARQING